MSKQTPKQIGLIEIESFFKEETDGTITYCWRPLSKNKHYSWYTRKTAYKKLPSSRHESSGCCNAEFFIDSEDRWKRIAQLEQSEESE